jgi:DNA-binding NarL/FixJ family response regulator
MDNTTRFNNYLQALRQFVAREGHSRVPAAHVEKIGETTINLGAWAGYTRQRYRRNQLSAERVTELASIPGWEWGPLRPGPATDSSRNSKILELHRSGRSLRQIADEFDLSRQRVHQIVRSDSDAQG